ncbi:hypothetical protein BGX28_002199 [Mortierella sp. GBA30]|nr:hypothetical protein BGX28_002199 [Mortierella sp. GBA30]
MDNGAILHKQPSHIEEKDLFDEDVELKEQHDTENSPIEGVRLVVPVTDDPSLVCITFRFWLLSLVFSILGAVINQYYFFRSTSGSFSTFFVNLASYSLGKGLAKVLPRNNITIRGYSLTLNPGPFNIKEHALIGIAVSTAATSAYAIEILTTMDLFLNQRINAFGSLVLIITTQCLGYGMAGVLRRHLVYPAEMVWWSNLVQVVFYNGIHNTSDFKSVRMIRGWSYMKFFWVFCGAMFVYEFLPQWLAPLLVYIDWICWINPFNRDFWAMFSSLTGAGILSLSFEWTSIGGSTLYLPLAAQLCSYGGAIASYWILLPILWFTNTLGTKTIGRPLTTQLYYTNGSRFNVRDFLNDDNSFNDSLYEAGPPVRVAPMYALTFFFSFVALASCCSHVLCFNGTMIWKSWKTAVGSEDEDVHTKMMKAYPEMPQLWYAVFYVVMVALSVMVLEVYGLQLPWWGLIVALAIGWILVFPICAMQAITGFSPGVSVIAELVCGYMLPGKPIANMVFKCYGYMSMYQCMTLLSDLKLGHYMKIPPRAMFVAQFWGAVVGGIFNYVTVLAIVNAQRPYLDGTDADPTGLWSGRMFNPQGEYGFVFYGFLLGAVLPVILWGLSKKYPKVAWSKFNVTIIAGGMSSRANGYTVGILSSLIVCLVFRFYMFRYHRGWWKKYAFILSAAFDTGAAFTGLIIFLFLGGGLSSKLSVTVPSWWFNHYTADGDNVPYMAIDRCGAAHGQWTGGM